jgi:hypothetical protein
LFSRFFKKKSRLVFEIEFLGFTDSILLKTIKEDIESRLPFEVRLYESLFDIESVFNEERNQFYSPDIIKHLLKITTGTRHSGWLW